MKEKDFGLNIKEALEEFKQGYKARDIKVVDAFIDRLFDKRGKTAILGTSFGEWMMGLSGVKELVESDWRYWGDVDIDTSNIDMTIFGDTAFVNLTGTVRYVFEYTEEKFDSYLNFVKHFFDPADQDYRMSSKAKAGNMGFVLTHFNQMRKEGKREYFYPLRINAVMTMQEHRAVFRFMKFAMDYYGQYPELRIDNQMMDMNEYYAQQQGLADACAKESRPEAKRAIEEFMKFISESFNGETKETDAINAFFSHRKDNYIIDTKGTVYKGEAAIEAVQSLRKTLSKLALDEKTIYSDVNGDAAWIVCNVLVSRTISEQEGTEALMSNIQRITEKDNASKDKLFAVQKLVAEYFFQHSRGEYFLWPLRITAMLTRENEQWKLCGASFSYPFYYILEGKYDAASMV